MTFNNSPKIISCKFNLRLCEVWTPVSRMGSGLVLPHCVREKTRWDLSLVTLGEDSAKEQGPSEICLGNVLVRGPFGQISVS